MYERQCACVSCATYAHMAWHTCRGRRQARPCLEVHYDGEQLLKGGADIGERDGSHFLGPSHGPAQIAHGLGGGG